MFSPDRTFRVAGALCALALISGQGRGQQTLFEFTGATSGAELGISVGGAGDVDGDGRPDFLIASPELGNGRVQVHSGFDGSVLHTFDGPTNDDFGFSVAGAGDVNGDGYADVFVGTPWASFGLARALSGLDGSVLHDFSGITHNGHFGWCVDGAGDVDNDGYADLIVGAPNENLTPAFTDNGQVFVFSGADGTVLHTFFGDSIGDTMGTAVAGAGDVNQDGYADLIVGVVRDDPNGLDSGSAKVYSGFDGALLYTFEGEAPFDFFGNSVAAAGDVNMDGFADVVVGAERGDGVVPDSGVAYVYSGFGGGLLLTLQGTQTGGRFGADVASAGDLDGDGRSDVLVGAPDEGPGGNRAGRVRAFSGADGTVIHTWFGNQSDEFLGYSVAGIGDIDGNGVPEVLAGAWGYDAPGIQGRARVYAGGPVTQASRVPVGFGCGAFGVTPGLILQPPRMGLSTPITVVGSWPETHQGTLLFSPGPATPAPIGGGCTAWVNPLSAAPLLTFQVQPAGTWSGQFPLASVPSFAGTVGVLQVALVHPSGEVAVTNGVEIVLGY